MALLRLGIIGLGMFGGKIAKLGAEIDAPGIIINASKKDIEKLGDLNGVTSFVVGDGKGTGKSRDTSKQFLIDHIGVVQEQALIELCNTCDVIIIAFSAGGGFGSGSGPAITNVLMEMYPEKLFIPLTTMPDDDETYTAQKHTEDTMHEIKKLEVPYLVFDNNKYKKLSSVDCLKKVNDDIKISLQILRGDFVVDSIDADDTASDMDERDLLTTISTPGRIVCGMLNPLKVSDVEGCGIIAALKKAIDESSQADLTLDKEIKASATMYALSGELMEKYSSSIKSDLQDTYGYHVTDYRNEAVNDETGNDFIAVILSGLTDPVERLDKIIAKRKKQEKEIVTRKASVSKFASDEESSSGLKLGVKSFGSDSAQKTEIPDVSNILKNLKINQ